MMLAKAAGGALEGALTMHLNFFWAGLVNLGQTGAIVPSQRILIEKMIKPVPQTYGGRIIELGAGTGALTFRLAARCPQARILACEINPVLARDTRVRVAEAGLKERVEVLPQPAEEVLSEFGRNGAKKPDYIISGIPLGTLDGEKTRSLLHAIWKALGDGGMYIQFQHSLLDKGKIRERFPTLRTAMVLLNFPPAVVYYAQRNGEGSGNGHAAIGHRRQRRQAALNRK
jgi:phospholipid N-methyltransferase